MKTASKTIILLLCLAFITTETSASPEFDKTKECPKFVLDPDTDATPACSSNNAFSMEDYHCYPCKVVSKLNGRDLPSDKFLFWLDLNRDAVVDEFEFWNDTNQDASFTREELRIVVLRNRVFAHSRPGEESHYAVIGPLPTPNMPLSWKLANEKYPVRPGEYDSKRDTLYNSFYAFGAIKLRNGTIVSLSAENAVAKNSFPLSSQFSGLSFIPTAFGSKTFSASMFGESGVWAKLGFETCYFLTVEQMFRTAGFVVGPRGAVVGPDRTVEEEALPTEYYLHDNQGGRQRNCDSEIVLDGATCITTKGKSCNQKDNSMERNLDSQSLLKRLEALEAENEKLKALEAENEKLKAENMEMRLEKLELIHRPVETILEALSAESENDSEEKNDVGENKFSNINTKRRLFSSLSSSCSSSSTSLSQSPVRRKRGDHQRKRLLVQFGSDSKKRWPNKTKPKQLCIKAAFFSFSSKRTQNGRIGRFAFIIEKLILFPVSIRMCMQFIRSAFLIRNQFVSLFSACKISITAWFGLSLLKSSKLLRTVW
jgi:hypothetical protein